MKNILILLVFLVPVFTWAGDEYQTPKLIEGSAYDAINHKYSVIGKQIRNEGNILWVVASPEAVLNQNSVNKIINDIRHKVRTMNGEIDFTEIFFYSSVSELPKSPAFRIFDHLALYNAKENKTYFGVAAKNLYGGWVHGPKF